MSLAMASKARIRPYSSTGQLSVARSGLSQREGLVLSGVVCTAFLIQQIVHKKRRRTDTTATGPSTVQAPAKQVEVEADDFQGWASTRAAVSLPDAEKHALVLLEEELPISVRELWDLIYDPRFVNAFLEKKQNRDAILGSWQKSDLGLVRKASYITPVKKNALGPSEAFTQEEYRCTQRGDGGFLVQVKAFTPKVPYGQSFHVKLHWAAVRHSERHTKLLVLGQVVFTKRCIVQGIIRRATHEGLREAYDMYRRHLLDNISSRGKSSSQGEIAGPSKVTADRTVSLATREAAEELIREGVFVSWGQIIGCLLYMALFVVLCRLSWLQDGRVLSWSKAYRPAEVALVVL